MNLEQAVIENFRKLPGAQQQEVLEFTKSLTEKTRQKPEKMTPQEKAIDWPFEII